MFAQIKCTEVLLVLYSDLNSLKRLDEAKTKSTKVVSDDKPLTAMIIQ